MIYIASPYSHEDAKIRSRRFRLVSRYTAHCLLKGEHVFSPIAHCHPMAVKYTLPKGFEFWENYDLEFVGMCSVIHVFMIQGWRESKGVTAEIAFAEEANIEVYYVIARSYKLLTKEEA